MLVVRDAMVSHPGRLPAEASARDAGILLQRPEVRAIFVTDGERLVGVVTRKTLVREVVATGRSPGETPLREIAEEPHYTIAPDLPVEEAFRFLEENDAERVPVVGGDGRLIGVLSRSVLQRRLAADAEPADEDGSPPDLPPAA